LYMPLGTMRQMVRSRLAGLEEAGGVKQRSRRTVVREQTLPVERLLGTALVLAFLQLRNVVQRTQIEAQLQLAEQMSWEQPCYRGVREFVMLFKVMLETGKYSRGWYYRGCLWNLVLLQHREGHFDLAPGLAAVLHATESASVEAVAKDAIPVVGSEEMLAAMPFGMWQVEGLPQEVRDQVWATMLAAERASELPFTWIRNPEEPPWKRTSLQAAADVYLRHQGKLYPQLGALLADLQGEAKKAVQKWRLSRMEALVTLQRDEEKDSRLRESHLSDHERQAARWAQRKSDLRVLMMAHPLMAIAYTRSTDPFTRTQRILVLCNSLLLMLFITLMLFYSKATQCCADYKAYLGCSPEGMAGMQKARAQQGRRPPWEVGPLQHCWEYASCKDLYRARDSGLLPEALAPGGHMCTAFPQRTLGDKLWLAVFVLGIMIPINLMLRGLFTWGGMPEVPRHWVSNWNRSRSESAVRTRQLENFTFLMMTLLLDVGRPLSRAIARYFLLLSSAVDLSFHYTQRAWRWLAKKLCNFYLVLWFLVQIHLYKRQVWHVLQELEVREQQKALKTAAALMAESTFKVAQHKMDSLAVQICYTLMALTWAVLLWYQLTYAVLIREMLGRETEAYVIQDWGLTVLIDNLFLHVFKSILVKYVVRALTTWRRNSRKDEEGLVGWYEDYVAKHLKISYCMSSEMKIDHHAAEAATYG
ncbi:hypothetical protein CYMTET_28627, partial [Cymbomonas tetramitiformis]